MLIPIVYQHDDFVVVNKPTAIAVQNEVQQSGILPLLCAQLGIQKLYLVHRLDKVTSGLLILAKSAAAAAYFGELFAQRQLDKYYLAISDKKPKKKQGLVRGDMYKVRDGKWALNKNLQRPAVTQFFSYSLGNAKRLFVLKPHTGKTHQIRVMMKSLGSPILGDTAYGGSVAERTYLHAYGLRFDYQQQPVQLSCLATQGEHFVALHSDDDSPYWRPWQLNWPALKSATRS